MAAKHALLSPSAAHRWLHCTAAPHLEANEPDGGSEYAAEGTLAHALCAGLLEKYRREDPSYPDALIHCDGAADSDMAEAVRTYCEYVQGIDAEAGRTCPDPYMAVETYLDLSDWAPGAFGTADCLIASDDTLDVMDFKFGRGVRVSAVRNPQLMMYALGALGELEASYTPQRVRLHIVQPRLGNISVWELPRAELMRWGEETLRPAAREAYRGPGRQVPGDWCRFCRVHGRCSAVAGALAADVNAAPDPRLLDAAGIAAVLERAAMYKSWLTAVEERAMGTAMAGETVPGFKLVRGRSIRRVTDPDRLTARLIDAGLSLEACYRPRELRTITELEKAVGRKRFAECSAGCIERPEGKPALVPESDSRPAWTPSDTINDIDLSTINTNSK